MIDELLDFGLGVDFLQIGHHEQQFIVILFSQERLDWDTAREVKGERDDRIVNNTHIIDVTVGNDAKILDIDAVLGLYAVLTIQAMFNDVTILIDEVQNCVSVVLLTGSENTYLVHSTQITERFFQV